MFEKVKELIQDADFVLVGLGEEFEEKRLFAKDEKYVELTNELQEKELQWLQPVLHSAMLSKKNSKAKEALKELENLLQDKNYYIISTCKNGLLEEAGFNKDRLVMPCGSYGKKQCPDHHEEGMLSLTEKEVAMLFDALDKREYDKIDLGVCPNCGKKLILNNIYADGYDENGYLENWSQYMKWLQLTLNKKLGIVELGVNLDFPSVIRWPFEKAGYLNKKAGFARVNEKLYQLTEELGEKGISVSKNAVDWLIEK